MKHFYIKPCLSFLIILFFSLSISAQNGKELWAKISKENVSQSRKVIRKDEPTKASYFRLDINGLKRSLQNAPNRKGFTGISNVIASFPNADGSFESYRILEAPIMVPSLQAKHPNIRSYAGQSIDTPNTTIRFSVTPQGLHTMTMSSNKGTQLIDPYSLNDNSYISYAKNDLPFLKDKFICGVIDDISSERENPIGNLTVQNADDGKMREFRLALACTAEYGNFHGETENSIKTAMGVTMTRVNGIYERELSITMLMIENASIIYFGDVNADPYTNDMGEDMLDENQTEIDAKFLDNDYDIGHVFSTGGGGVATLNSPCRTGIKARGVTGLASPVGDIFDIEFVCHEMGHQFGAPHTWNGNTGFCTTGPMGQRTASNAYEPGSGSTIMSYAGICDPQNVQENSDDYFHQKSLEMIWANITTGLSQCANAGAITTGNTAPSAAIVGSSSYIIPISTPYKLTGSSTDVETTSTHTYTWEQWDLGASGVPTESTDLGPLVRSFKGTDNPIRYIPRLDSVLKNGSVSTTWEKLASVSRTINFKLTVRDNDVRGGQTDTADMVLTTDAAAGPFLVTSQNTDQLVYSSSESISVTWDKANTDIGTVDTDFVNILLSTDGGLTYPHVLASGTANDESEMVTLPNVEMPYCRIMVEGAGNIFYALNTKDFAIGNYTYEAMDVCDNYLFNFGIAIPLITDGTINGYGMTVNDSETISDVNINVDMTHNDVGDIDYGFGVPFEAASVVNVLTFGNCNGASDVDLTFDDEGSAISCASTANGDFVLPVNPLSVADGTDSSGDWIFWMRDDVDNSVNGVLNSVTLTICHSELVPTLGADDFNFEDSFSVYPNPNNGEFNVKLNSSSGNKINISVYDIRGRRVFDNIYNNSSNFNKIVNLNNVQSGIYILKVSDGERSGTKKIIVN